MAKAIKAIPLPQSQVIFRFAAISQLRDAASRGELIYGDEQLKPVTLDPELWELRWRFGRELYRQYHAEPASQPGWLLALRFHRKLVVTDDDAETLELQDDEIIVAQRRMLGLAH